MYNRDIKVQFLQAFAFADQILPGSGTFDLSVGPLLKLYCSMKLSIRKKKYRCLLEKKNSTTSLLLCVKAEILLFRNINISRNSPCFSVRTVKIVMRLFPCCQRAAKADRFSRLFPPANRKLCFDWSIRFFFLAGLEKEAIPRYPYPLAKKGLILRLNFSAISRK